MTSTPYSLTGLIGSYTDDEIATLMDGVMLVGIAREYVARVERYQSGERYWDTVLHTCKQGHDECALSAGGRCAVDAKLFTGTQEMLDAAEFDDHRRFNGRMDW